MLSGYKNKILSFIASVLLTCAFLAYSLALFTNYWFTLTVDSRNERLGFYEICATGVGCRKIADAEALTFEIVGFVLLVFTVVVAAYAFALRSQTESNKGEAKLLLLLNALTVGIMITGWAKFTESKTDFSSKYTSPGWSYYLVLAGSALAVIALIFVVIVQKVTKPVLFLVPAILLLLSLVAYSAGLFTYAWIVSTKESPLKITNGFFRACINGVCVNDVVSLCLSLELIGFVFLLTSVVISVLLTLFYKRLDTDSKFRKRLLCLVCCVISIGFIVAGWARLIVYAKKDTVLSALKYGWSFYLVIPAFSLTTIGVALFVILIVKNRD